MSTHAMAVPLHRGEVHPGVSVPGFVAGFFFAIRSIFVLASARWLGTGTEAGVALSFLGSAALAFAATLQAFGYRTYTVRSAIRSAPMRTVLAYLTFAGLSLTWTNSASRGSSLLYWLAIVADVLLVLLLARGMGSRSAAESLFKGYILGAAIAASVAWLMPAAADLRLGDIEYFNTNQIANLCGIALLLVPVAGIRSPFHTSTANLVLGLTLLRSLSKATLVAFVVAQGFRILRDRTLTRRRKTLITLTTLLALFLFSGLIENYYGEYTTAGNQAETLTGRTAIWAWTWNAALEHPWVGNGFDAMWKVAPPFGGELFEARHAENELLQQFFAYGVVGVLLLLMIYISVLRLFRAQPHSSLRVAGTALVIYAAVRGVAEAEPFDLLLPLWLLASLATLASSGDNREPLRQSAPKLASGEHTLEGHGQ